MIDLFKTEWLRFRAWALAAGLAHLLTLTFFDRLADPLQQPLTVYRAYLGTLVALGFAFGMVQLSDYARLTAWIELIHRPVSPRRIGAAIMLAGGSATAIAVFVPVLLLLPFHHLTGGHVESRHLLFPLAAWVIATMGYLIGVHLRLGPPKLAWTSAIVLVWLYQAAASGQWAVMLQLVALGIAFALALTDFRPDRQTLSTPRKAGLIALGSVAIAVTGTFFIGFLMQVALMFLGIHPLNGVPPEHGVMEATSASGDDVLIHALATQRTESARFWADQAALSDIVTIGPEYVDLTPRNSLSNPGDNGIVDSDAQLGWVFDRDDMRYHAIDQRSRRPAGISPSPAMPAVPIVSGNDIIAGNTIWRYSSQLGEFVRRIALPAGERILAPPSAAWDGLAVLSDRALRIYDGRITELGEGAVPPPVEIALPGPPAGLIRIDMLELLDGYLVSFTYGANVVDGRGTADQQLWRVDEYGAQRVFGRALDPDYPAVMRYRDLWFAPVLLTGVDKLQRLFAPGNLMARRGERKVPASILILAIAIHLLAALAAWLLARPRAETRRGRIAWGMACLLFGPALLIALVLAQPRRVTC